MAQTNPFTEALKAEDPVRLRQVFDAHADDDDAPHRTTLNRWLNGTVPPRGDFVKVLAEELENDDLYRAWTAARGGGTVSPLDRAVETFQGLSDEQRQQFLDRLNLSTSDLADLSPASIVDGFESLDDPDLRDEVFHLIRGHYLTKLPSRRSRPDYKIEIMEPDDVEPGQDDHLLIRFTLAWTGAIPPNANVQIAAEQQQLGAAYDDPNCIFREIVILDPRRLHDLLKPLRSPVLNINPLTGDAPSGSHFVGEPVSGRPGRFQFRNEEAKDARVRLSLTYPHPRGRPVFFISHGDYQVPDHVDITLTLHSPRTAKPRAFPYMPPGRRREWTSSFVPPNELLVTLGKDDNLEEEAGKKTVFGDGDGVVLSWTEAPA